MKENDVAFFGELLGLDTEAVNGAIEDGSVGEKIKALNLMGADKVETLKENLAKDVKTTYFGELVEKAKQGELDPDLYGPIKGAVHEMIEKDLAKTYEVEKGTLKEMIAKISNNGQSNDNAQLTQKISDLQGINETLVKEKEDAVTAAKADYEGRLLSRDKVETVNSIPFDFSDVDEGELEKATTSRKQILTDVFDARYALSYSEGNTVVKDSKGEIMKDRVTLAPLPASDVMKSIATELGLKLKSPETGGQGGSSSGQNANSPFPDKEAYDKHCRDKKIQPTSAEGLKLWAERRPK